jgi:hypothetical protein
MGPDIAAIRKSKFTPHRKRESGECALSSLAPRPSHCSPNNESDPDRTGE